MKFIRDSWLLEHLETNTHAKSSYFTYLRISVLFVMTLSKGTCRISGHQQGVKKFCWVFSSLPSKCSCPHVRLPLLITTRILSLGHPNSNFRLRKTEWSIFKKIPLFYLPSLTLLLFKSSIHVGIFFNAT